MSVVKYRSNLVAFWLKPTDFIREYPNRIFNAGATTEINRDIKLGPRYRQNPKYDDSHFYHYFSKFTFIFHFRSYFRCHFNSFTQY